MRNGERFIGHHLRSNIKSTEITIAHFLTLVREDAIYLNNFCLDWNYITNKSTSENCQSADCCKNWTKLDICLSQRISFLLMLILLFTLPVFHHCVVLASINCYLPALESILRMLHTSCHWRMCVHVTSIPNSNGGSLTMAIDVVCVSRSLVYTLPGTYKIEMKHYKKYLTSLRRPNHQAEHAQNLLSMPVLNFFKMAP